MALLQSSGDQKSDQAFLHTRLTRPASEAPSAEPRCAIVANITLPSPDTDSHAQVVEPMGLDLLRVSGEKAISVVQFLHIQRGGLERVGIPMKFNR